MVGHLFDFLDPVNRKIRFLLDRLERFCRNPTLPGESSTRSQVRNMFSSDQISAKSSGI